MNALTEKVCYNMWVWKSFFLYFSLLGGKKFVACPFINSWLLWLPYNAKSCHYSSLSCSISTDIPSSLYASPVSADARRRVSSAGSVRVRCGLQHRGGSTLSRVTAHHLSRDRHQKSILRTVTEIHANGAIWNCSYLGGHSGNHR